MSTLLETDFSNWLHFLQLSTIIFVVIFIRYLVFSGTCHWVIRNFFQKQWLHAHQLKSGQIWREMGYSMITSLIFALSGSAMVIFWQKGWAKLYPGWSDYPLWYFPVSIALYLLVHETYYYWLHRWMHKPAVYRWIHKTHHDSLHTSALTSFSFHPIESVLQAIIIPVLTLIIPLHVYGLFLLLLIMTLSGTINHVGFEMFPHWWARNRLSKWVIGATHHDQHHQRFRYNFGLYFTFWDRWMKTESPDFEARYSEVTAKSKARSGHR